MGSGVVWGYYWGWWLASNLDAVYAWLKVETQYRSLRYVGSTEFVNANHSLCLEYQPQTTQFPPNDIAMLLADVQLTLPADLICISPVKYF